MSAERVWELFRSAVQVHVRRNALSLIGKLGKWDSIHYLTRAVGDADDNIADLARRSIERWLAQFNRSFSSPEPEQLAQLSNALDQCGSLLNEETEKRLRFLIKTL